MIPRTIEYSHVREAAERVVAEYGDNTNPIRIKVNEFDGEETYVCLYTDPENRFRHCIAGQVFVELGLEPPGPSVETGILSLLEDSPETRSFYPDIRWSAAAITYLYHLQVEADGNPPEGPVRWSEIDLDQNGRYPS